MIRDVLSASTVSKNLKRMLPKSLLVLLVLLGLTEIALYKSKTTQSFFKIFNHHLTSREILNDYLSAYKNENVKSVLLGDSVFFGSGLRANNVKKWQEHTIGAYLGKEKSDDVILDLSLDGSLVSDYVQLYKELRRKVKPKWIIINLNYRMFADAVREKKAIHSRKWLEEEAGSSNSIKLQTGLRRYWQLYRYSEAWRQAIFFPSREEALIRFMKKLIPERSWKSDEDRELILQLKLKSYYFSSIIDKKNNLMKDLEVLLELLKEDNQAYILFFTPQNSVYLDPILDKHAYERNRELIKSVCEKYTNQEDQLYFDWANKYESSAFFDHCHLIPEFNLTMARELTILMDKEKKYE